MAGESCNLDKDEAEILKPSSPPQAAAAPPPPSLFSKPAPAPLQEFTAQRAERPEAPVAAAAAAKRDDVPKQGAQLGNRCSSCSKRVGLTGFRCRCGELFCPRHRYSDVHDCSFDYKAAGRAEISKNNPVVRAAKIIKI